MTCTQKCNEGRNCSCSAPRYPLDAEQQDRLINSAADTGLLYGFGIGFAVSIVAVVLIAMFFH